MTISSEHMPADVSLIALLRRRARALSPEAAAVAIQLERHAAALENRGTSNDELLKFNAFAQHYKGLCDVVVPGVSEVEWGNFVRNVKGLSRAALREEGLDRSLLGRIHRFFQSPAKA